MLKKVFRNAFGVARIQYRTLCSDNNGPKLKDKDIIGDELAEALDNVVDDISKNDPVEKKKTRSSILSKLIESTKESFDTATGHETVELLYDREVASLLEDMPVKPEEKGPHRFFEIRQDSRATAALRKEIFYRAFQSGKSEEEARLIAEESVSRAEEKLRQRREAKLKGAEEERELIEKTKQEKEEKEGEFFQMAYEWMEKNLYSEQSAGDLSSNLPDIVEVDPSVLNIFDKPSNQLDVLKDTKSYKVNNLDFWNKWDLRKAEIINQGMGPRNIIEQHIEWTKQKKLWPYPINNEYELGEESNVGFYDHIFLQRHLSKYNLPKTGPIAHFMELVCVGLSKNSYMTAAKKKEHLDWFGKFFDSKRQETIKRLHEKEQEAAANSV